MYILFVLVVAFSFQGMQMSFLVRRHQFIITYMGTPTAPYIFYFGTAWR
jgi:hypothetical protein